jgi:pyruvate/2-oxoglutarate dehydrogenase complex dihydrolipoamide acyltransferase (E2) component
MTFPLRTPRVNNNDDTVRLSAVFAKVGEFVKAGDTVAEVETDKATFGVEATKAGYFLKCLHEVGEKIEVGSVLAWMGDTVDDALPETPAAIEPSASRAEPTLKAAMLLREYGLTAGDVPSTSDRLGVSDVQAYVASKGIKPASAKSATAASPTTARQSSSDVPALRQELSVIERGMLRTVAWHGSVAVPGYVEVAADAAAWEAYGVAFQKAHSLLMNPMLPLMAYRLVALVADNPRLNATVQGEEKILYQTVNIGFTVQSGDNLYLTVTRDAQKMSALEFVKRSLELQKAAMKNKLKPAETSGATIAFTSMARWGVVRHQPVLAPDTSLMIAHSAPLNGQSALGATYDHRVLSGADAVLALNYLKTPPEAE